MLLLLEQKKKRKKTPGFLHPPTEAHIPHLSFGPHHPPMPAFGSSQCEPCWAVTTRINVTSTGPGKIPKNVRFLQVKLFISVAQIPPFLLHHKTPIFCSKPTHCSWFTPFFSKFLADFCPENFTRTPSWRSRCPPLPV